MTSRFPGNKLRHTACAKAVSRKRLVHRISGTIYSRKIGQLICSYSIAQYLPGFKFFLFKPGRRVYSGCTKLSEVAGMKNTPSMDQWLREAKAHESAPKVGMYLFHNGVVRQSARARVRQGDESAAPVRGMLFSYDPEKVEAAIAETYKLPGIYYIRAWLNEGELQVGDDIMLALIGGDIRPNVVDALQYLVGRIKNECVTETELN